MTGAYLFADAPRRVYWEITRACDLACLHCRAEAAPDADPGQLDTKAGLKLLRQLAEATPKPHVIFTGGDPLKRADLFELIATARGLGLDVSVSPSATPLLTEEAIDRLVAAGVSAISLSIDGASAEAHDAIRGVAGCYERTLVSGRRARQAGLAFQVNTLVSAETLGELPRIDALVREIGASRWSLFFLVNVGRGTVLTPISAEQTEELLGWLAERAKVPGLVVTTTEAPHFRRVALAHRDKSAEAPRPHGHGAGMRDGNGVMFIAHDGEVSPSGFLPLSAGNVKMENPIRVYRESPLFVSLREVDGFHGRCGRCEFRQVCGGSRARAYVASGDPLGEDPLCMYEPRVAVSPKPTAELPTTA
jgi:radical SAM protein